MTMTDKELVDALRVIVQRLGFADCLVMQDYPRDRIEALGAENAALRALLVKAREGLLEAIGLAVSIEPSTKASLSRIKSWRPLHDAIDAALREAKR